MKLATNIRLLPTPEQADLLTRTLETCNAACRRASEAAAKLKTSNRYKLHRAVYKSLRNEFDLSANVAVRCVAKTADAHKVGPKDKPKTFRKHAAQPYDARIFRLCSDNEVSIWCLGGRQRITYACSDQQRELLERRGNGEIKLMLVRGKWLVAISYEAEQDEPVPTKDIVGIDLGIVNLAVDSDGACFTGATVEENRRKHHHRRRNLQRKGTKSAKRKLKKLSGKESRYKKDVNHCVSKAIVGKAKRNCCVIALEDLTGIRDRIKATRRQRRRLHAWPFFQLRLFIEYKAALAGISVVLVSPVNTSRACPECGHVSKANRPDRDTFKCESCDHAGPSDHIAARNIRARAVVNLPMADAA